MQSWEDFLIDLFQGWSQCTRCKGAGTVLVRRPVGWVHRVCHRCGGWGSVRN
jgi:DnaJ-class molecular chaperone